MLKPKALILTGDGINCERETSRAFELAGADTKIIHINDLLSNPKQLAEYQIFALPGGFSFGDDLGSGQVLALKIQSVMNNELKEFVARKRPIIGICNGFQALTKMAMLPEPFLPRTMALAHNSGGNFINRWVELELEKDSVCIWTKFIDRTENIILPIRHGEGRIVFQQGEEETIHRKLNAAGQISIRYKLDINGSYGRIAGLCDPSGLVFGLMPHPEAAVSMLQYPRSTSEKDRTADGIGLMFFKSCVKYLQES